jgi:Domain of unknown function (DUF5668)
MTHRRDLIGPGVLIVIGVILLLRNLGYIPASLDQWWPVILILIGLWILFARSTSTETTHPWGPAPHAPSTAPASPGEGRRHPPTGGLILVGLGLALLVGNLLGGRATGALIIIALGLAILAGRLW